MRVKAIKEFYDLERKKSVLVGDEFEVSVARGKALTSVNNKAGAVLCEDITPTTDEAEKTPVKKARAKKEA